MASEIAQKESPVNHPVRVLVVDDEPGMRQLLTRELTLQGYDVAVAASGEEAIELFRSGNFSLVITDAKMPGIGGIAAMEAMKSFDPDIEVIIATGYADLDMVISSMRKGAFDFLQKPFNLNELDHLIERALERRNFKVMLAVHEASKVVFQSVRMEELIPKILGIASALLKADDVSIMLSEEEKWQVIASSGHKEQNPALMARGAGVADVVARDKEPLLISGPLNEDPRFSHISSCRNIKSSLVCPLLVQGEFLGVLNFNRVNNPEPFTSSDLRTATIFSAQIAQAIKNAQLYENLEKAQQHLVQTEKLAAIGQLAAGVAHELNNPLTGILGFSELLLKEEGLTPQQREDLKSIYDQSLRCRRIIQSLLQFSRKKEAQKEPISIPDILQSTLQLIQKEFELGGKKIEIEIANDLPPVLADPIQLQQVFLNMLTNARDALEGNPNGHVRIQARLSKPDKIAIAFHDNGCGIEAAHVKKIFDPFFTTKPPGKGTGLGLSISYGIVKDHGGHIFVDGKEGKGATFIVELPVFQEGQ